MHVILGYCVPSDDGLLGRAIVVDKASLVPMLFGVGHETRPKSVLLVRNAAWSVQKHPPWWAVEWCGSNPVWNYITSYDVTTAGNVRAAT